MRIPYISVLAAGALALALCGCADYYGPGYGGYYGGYGYGAPYVGVGYSSGTYPYYGGNGYGYGSPFGWYDDFYYPGTGLYVYDTYRRPHVMTTSQHTYWSRRSPALRTSSTTRVRANWSGFDRRNETSTRRRGRTY
jgi:hypothetical protein